MFCWRCGKELPEQASFCPGCGTQIDDNQSVRGENIAKAESSLLRTVNSNTINERMNLLKDFKGVFWGTIVCLIVAILLVGGEMFEITYKLFTDYSVSLTMFGGREALKVILVLANLIAVVLMLAPLVTGKSYERYNLVPAVIIPIANILILLIVMMSAKEEMNKSMLIEAVHAKASLTGNGWVFLIVNFIAMLLAHNAKNIAPKTVKRENTDATKEENNNRPYRCAFCDMEGPYEGECPRCGSVSKKYE